MTEHSAQSTPDVADGVATATPAPLSPVTIDSPLVAEAVAALEAAADVQLSAEALLVEERNTWEPESWLIHCCWQTLADAAIGSEALAVAGLLVERHPNAPLQVLYRLARQCHTHPALGPLLAHELQRWRYRLFHTHPEEGNQIEPLLLVATSAALATEPTLAAACLERLDNLDKGWERVVARPELREQLARCIFHIGPHPLTNDLINVAIRRFDDAGAQLLYALTTLLTGAQEAAGRADRKDARLLDQALTSLRQSTLVSLQSRRIAATILGQAGEITEVLSQVEAIEQVQAAQRETGFAPERENSTVLRQVKRTNANRDIDFLVYTLRNAVDAMSVAAVERTARIALADKVAMLGLQSDGWTAASAAAMLVELGALRYAVEVVERVAPNDPARSEGLLMLVRGLMAVGERTLATEQAKRALDWAESLPVRNPERALTWGLAELYLQQQQPGVALQLLERWREPAGWRARLRKLWREPLDDDGLRNGRLRLQALLQLSQLDEEARIALLAAPMVGADSAATATATQSLTQNVAAASVPTTTAALEKEIAALVRTLRRAAVRLLDGEALIHFYVDGLLRPLLQSGHYAQAWPLLPELQTALCVISGNRQSVRMREVAELFVALLQSSRQPREAFAGGGSQPVLPDPTEAQAVIEGFLRDLWRASVERGLWQVVHLLEGALPLIFLVEGTPAVVALAQAAVKLQRKKLPPVSTPLTAAAKYDGASSAPPAK